MLSLYKKFIQLSWSCLSKTLRAKFVAVLILCIAVSQTVVAETNLNDPKQVIQKIKNINWVTEQFPPFNYLDPKTGEITGLAVEVLSQIFIKLGISSDHLTIKLYPWARGYHKVLNDPETGLFSTTYTLERLQKMKFVGPIGPNAIAVIAAKSSQLVVKLPEDLNRLKIGVVRDAIGEQLLISQGVKIESMDRLNSGLSLVQKLAAGRIDAISYSYASAQILFKAANINPDDFEIIHALKYSDIGYSFHHSTDARILEPIRKALDELIVDGSLAEVQNRYGLKAANE